MSKDRSLYVRVDVLTELLLGHLQAQENINKSELIRKSIYAYAVANMEQEDFNSLVQLAMDMERL